MKRFIIYLASVAVVLGLFSLSQLFSSSPSLGAPAQQANCTTFPETGKTVCGKFLQYWNTHGGLAQQGFPISSELQETSDTDGKTYTMQYFERAVFEAHPENQPPNDVLLSLLGTFTYQQKYPAGAPGQVAATDPGAADLFPYGHGKYKVRGRFVVYYNANGQIAQFGYPLSNEFQEVSDLDGKTYMVQYFERVVFELHPENQAPYDVLLSQLGTLRYRYKYGGGPVSSPTPNPTPPSGPPASSTAAPEPTFTFTAVPPTNTDMPKPTKTYTPMPPTLTPVPTTCPALHIESHCSGSVGFVAISWNATGGGGQIRGELTTIINEGMTTREITEEVGPSGIRGYGLPCGIPHPRVTVHFTLELHDECGQTGGNECGGTVAPEPCP